MEQKDDGVIYPISDDSRLHDLLDHTGEQVGSQEGSVQSELVPSPVAYGVILSRWIRRRDDAFPIPATVAW